MLGSRAMTHPYVIEAFTSDERAILLRYFTNVDRPVFALKNLPEIVKGALFARYSRTPKSLRRLFLDEFREHAEEGADRLAAVGTHGEGSEFQRPRVDRPHAPGAGTGGDRRHAHREEPTHRIVHPGHRPCEQGRHPAVEAAKRRPLRIERAAGNVARPHGHVGAASQRGDEGGHGFGRMAQVGVHHHGDVRAARENALQDCAAEATLPRPLDEPHPRQSQANHAVAQEVRSVWSVIGSAQQNHGSVRRGGRVPSTRRSAR